MQHIKVLIIEDEIHASKELQRILLKIDQEIFVQAIIDNIEDGVAFLSSEDQPDLIFSDIQLADGTCFDIYERVEVKSPIIFCTAYDQYLLEAFDTNAVSYLLKPITEEKVANALQKFEKLKQVFEPQKTKAAIGELSQQLRVPYKTALLVEQRGKIIPLQVKDIAFLYLDKTVTNIYTLNQQHFYISSSLDELERTLDPQIFYRANRQFIVNRNAIVDVERFFSRKLIVHLCYKGPENVLISKAKASGFLRWLEGN
ncbi:LytR/AlgR family response regulator transcription factor [Olivibacter jilunii]|uniref:LytR/AlgR family response regulator transcription factor n=1 Tax=Olivibacter jilunii TaxID=985016 RepID=UPI001F5F2548|nr:LytTR family DNA-binding domain-containing protein [Olivibacter jilunii]